MVRHPSFRPGAEMVFLDVTLPVAVAGESEAVAAGPVTLEPRTMEVVGLEMVSEVGQTLLDAYR